MNGHAPEKSADLIDFIHFYVLLGTSRHQKEAILSLLAADCNHGILNGYAPEYVKARHIAEYVCWTIYNRRNYYGIIAHKLPEGKTLLSTIVEIIMAL